VLAKKGTDAALQHLRGNPNDSSVGLFYQREYYEEYLWYSIHVKGRVI
jgi:hypothetical protein